MVKIRRFEDVEFIIPANNTALKINFPDIPQLRSDVDKDVVVKAIRIYPADALPESFNGNTNLTREQLGTSFLTLYVNGEESSFRMPSPDFVVAYSSDADTPLTWVNEEKEFDNIQVDWTKSYFTFTSALGNSTILAISLGVNYDYLPAGTMNAIRARRALAAAQGMIT